MSKYLLEIGTEELPAKFSHSVLDQFKSLIEFELDKKLIKFEHIVVTSTPRRIVLLLEGLVDYAEDKICLLYTSPSPRDPNRSRMPSSA